MIYENHIKNTSQVVNFQKQSQLKEVWRRLRKNKLALFGLCVMVILLFFSLTASIWVPYKNAITMNIRDKLLPPNSQYWFGTDGYGRDMLARCLHGGKISLIIGFVSAFSATIAGATIGLLCGFYGGKFDAVVMRFLDIFAALPPVLWALTIVAALGNSVPNLIIALVISRIPSFVRVVRSSVFSVSNQEFIEAAKAGGTSELRIMFRHILPNVVGPLIVQTTMSVSNMILTAASMSFLGLGVNSPQPEWGALISEAKEFLRVSPYLMIIPGLLIIFSSLAMNLLGDGLRDALDPRLKS